jgi:hypothetical protein
MHKRKMLLIEVVAMNKINVGDAVRRLQPWDGSEQAGLPAGPILSVLKVHSCDTFEICELSDGRSEFDFNLSKQSWYVQFAKMAC